MMQKETVYVLAALAAIALLGVAPAVAAETGRIAFVSMRDGSPGEVYLMDDDGSDQTRMTTYHEWGEPWGPGLLAWSPSGSHIAFYTGGPVAEIWVMPADGTGPSLGFLSTFWLERPPRWSPDGSRLAYYTTYKWGHHMGVSVVNPDGTGEVQLAPYGGELAWSPNGSVIAFAQNEGFAWEGQAQVGGSWEIFAKSADGTGETFNLTANPANDTYPAWSPDGTRIAFASDRDGATAVYLMAADGGDPVRLAAGDGPLSWSPDGTRIAFSSRRDGSEGTFVMRADGTGEPARVAPAGDVAWAPNSRELAFAQTRDGNTDIYVTNADGIEEWRLTTDPAADTGPAWWGVADEGVLTPPVAAFSFLPAAPTVLDTVAFADGSSDPDGWITGRVWDFGDGTASRSSNPNHTYTAPGVYTVTLAVADDDGLTSPAASRNVTVLSPPVRLPSADGIPTDSDADGRYDDVNGNGRADFADVVLYFNQMTWITANEPVALFDYNGNSRIDFADVVWLFDHL